MTVEELVADALRARELDGLTDGSCSCRLPDLFLGCDGGLGCSVGKLKSCEGCASRHVEGWCLGGLDFCIAASLSGGEDGAGSC